MSDSVAQSFWDANPTIGLNNQWTANATVGETIYRRMTGGITKWWLTWLMEDYFRDRRFTRMLSPGCGTGDHEMAVAATGKVDQIDAFDFSSECVRLANGKAKAAGRKMRFYQDDLNTFSIPKSTTYDLILCSGSVHHCRELERFFDVMSRGLTRDGYFVINEYIGPCYNIYPPEQVKIVNRLLNVLPKGLKTSAEAQFHNNPLQRTLQHDPSESVRSQLILPFLQQFFDIELRRDYGGNLLHLMYPLLNHEKFTDPKAQGVAASLRLLLEFEAILVEERVLKSDFALCICRPKK